MTETNKNPLETQYQQYIHISKYARYNDALKRRETWEETVERYCRFMEGHIGELIGNDEYTLNAIAEIKKGIYNSEVMPSMRALMTAGKALKRDNAAGYNCAAIAVDSPRVFDELFYLLMNGAGTGFSVERGFINKMPTVAESMHDTDTTIVVQDSKEGWAKALKELIALLYNGDVPKWDLSGVRPAGSRLKTFGGRSSGPEPLNLLFKRIISIFKKAVGRKLNSIECHDILCHIASTVIVGGVRRCLPGDYRVQTDVDSWKNIKELKIGEKIYIAGEYHNISNFFDQGEQEVIRIQLEDNTYHESTAEHRWYVFDRKTAKGMWCKTKDLSEKNVYFPSSDDTLVKVIGLVSSRTTKTYDIEIDSNDHAFYAKHPSGAIGISHNSAMISLSNLTDDRMRRAKSGEFYLTDPQRFLANNSVMYTEKPDLDSFLGEFRSIYKSKAGERGMVNQEALRYKAVTQCGRNPDAHWVMNPCSEVILQASGGLCNLSEVVIRPEDTLEILKQKVRLATIIGTIQSTLTNFKYLRKIWKDNAEEERLIGVSFTGIMDHVVMSGRESKDKLKQWLTELKEVARVTNEEWAYLLRINKAKQLSCVKPSGSVSQLCNCSSGIHPRYAKHFIRKVTQDNKDPLTEMLKSQGVPHQIKDDKTYFAFPISAPDCAVVQSEMDAIEQLELWLIYRDYWCDGNPSQTIYYTDASFPAVQAWVWEHWDSIGGLSFFPVDDSIYEISPYNPCSKEEVQKAIDEFPVIDWSRLSEFEVDDNTTSSQEYACAGGACEL